MSYTIGPGFTVVPVASGGGPLKADGTPDMRYKANWSAPFSKVGGGGAAAPFSQVGGGGSAAPFSQVGGGGAAAAFSLGAVAPRGILKVGGGGGGAAFSWSSGGASSPFSLDGGGGASSTFSLSGGGGASSAFSWGSGGGASSPFSLGGGAPMFPLGGGAVCHHAPDQRTFFAPEVKPHDGLLPVHAAFTALTHAFTYGKFAPGTGDAPGRDQVMAMSATVYREYAQHNPALCAQLLSLTDDLVNRLVREKQEEDAAAAAGVLYKARAYVLPGGGSHASLRSSHLSSAIFMQTLVRLACTLHPVSA